MKGMRNMRGLRGVGLALAFELFACVGAEARGEGQAGAMPMGHVQVKGRETPIRIYRLA